MIGLTILTLGVGSAGVIGIVAAVGFGSGAVTSMATQMIFNGSIDIGQVFLDGFTGSMTACISMLPIGVIGVSTFGGLIGIGSYISSSSYNGTEITTEGALMSFGIGFFAGLISGGGYGYEKYTKYRYVSGMAKSSISPKKIAMYSLKSNISKSNIKGSIARFTISMVFFGGVYTAYQNENLRIDIGGR